MKIRFCKHCLEQNRITGEFLREYQEEIKRMHDLIHGLVDEGKIEEVRQLKAVLGIIWEKVHPAVHEEIRRRNTPN